MPITQLQKLYGQSQSGGKGVVDDIVICVLPCPEKGARECAGEDVVLDSLEVCHNQMMQLLSDPRKVSRFARLRFDLLKIAE